MINISGKRGGKEKKKNGINKKEVKVKWERERETVEVKWQRSQTNIEQNIKKRQKKEQIFQAHNIEL